MIGASIGWDGSTRPVQLAGERTTALDAERVVSVRRRRRNNAHKTIDARSRPRKTAANAMVEFTWFLRERSGGNPAAAGK
jgi:hypothetical protein